MRFVLANRELKGAGGTEVHLVTLGEQLQRLGHDVHLYATELGDFAEHARRRGLAVRGSLLELPEDADVVFSQDGIVAYELARRYPGALALFRLCSDVFDFELPPQLPGAVDLIVVLSDRYERLARAGAGDVPVLRLRVPIDVDRLAPLSTIRERPRTAIVLGNYDDRVEMVRQAWGPSGVEVRTIVGGAQAFDVAAALAVADIVVAKSRAALDAMACGRAVYVFDFFGGDGWVTPESYGAMEADNFAGQATSRVVDAAALAGDLAGYRREMGTVNRDLVLQHHGARDHAIALLAAIAGRAPGTRLRGPEEELARLISVQCSLEMTVRELRSSHRQLRAIAETIERRAARDAEAVGRAERERDEAAARAIAAEARLGEAERRAAELERRLGTIGETRAWKLVNRYWNLARRWRRAD